MTALGPAVERRPDMSGRVCLVTGGTSGVGRAMAGGLSKLGARVVILARDRERGRAAAVEMTASSGHAVEVVVGDLADLRSIGRAAADFGARWDRLDVLAHAAGILCWNRQMSADGYELTFAVNVLGPALLTRLMLPLLERSAPARITAACGGLATLAHARLDLDDLPYRAARFAPLSTALQAMLARVLYCAELARKLQGRGIAVNAFYPGLVRSRLDRGLPWPLRVPVRLVQPFLKAGSASAVRAAADPSLAAVTGAFLAGRRVLELRSRRVTPEDSQRLWSLIERLLDERMTPGTA